ncbi:hypothetical protein ACQP2P_43415 [Dactylosporangium sp. CA-139114]|uniref:hypothetical protein n=1 Tax=Dactylosporangium sp. CA-139114 TaxID=3239931 RepID=UPI003D95E8B6
MRALWLLLLIVPVLCGLPFTRAAGVLVSVAAMLAVAAAARPALALGAVVSIAVTAIYRGPPRPAGLWFIFEFTPLLIPVTRTARAGRWVAALAALAVPVLPLRVTLHQPEHRLDGSVLVVAAAFACAVAAAGLGLFLRAGDARRARALAAARRSQRLEPARDLHDLVAHEVTRVRGRVPHLPRRGQGPLHTLGAGPHRRSSWASCTAARARCSGPDPRPSSSRPSLAWTIVREDRRQRMQQRSVAAASCRV